MASFKPAPPEVFFKGRPGDTRLGQWAAPVTTLPSKKSLKHEVVVVGYPDDTGVKNNLGRAGAAAGPDSVRKHLYRMTMPANLVWEKKLGLYDLGNSEVSSSLEKTHAFAAQAAEVVAVSGRTAIALGGGHDFAASTFRGFIAGTAKKGGILNIDPHLDAREMEGTTPHSGNAFRWLLENGTLKGRDLVQFGARANRNTRSSWEFCRKQKVSLLPFEEIRASKIPSTEQFERALAKIARSCDFVGVTLDIDACSDAEGSSAAPVLGFSAWELCCFAAIAGSSAKVRYLEIAEVAPTLDATERSSRIAAEVIFRFLLERSRLS